MRKLDLGCIDDIDALSKMLKLAFSNEDWTNMIRLADRLYEESAILYHYQLQQPTKKNSHSRPLIYYIGYSQLCKGVAYQKLKKFNSSRDCIEKYTDLSWMKGVEENEKYIIEDFRIFASGNTFTVDLMEGRHSVLGDYVQYLKQYRRELVPGMITILEYAIKNDLSIDWVLADLSKELGEIERNPDNSTTARYYTEYLYLLSLYKYKQGDYHDAAEKNLVALTTSVKLEDNTAFKKLTALFEAFREFASNQQEQVYKLQLKSILERVLMNEKDISFSTIHSGSN